MEPLKCDICGGKLVMDAGGKTASCEYCGMQYSVARIQEKVQEIKGAVNISGEIAARQTGTSSDVQQWKALLNKYISVMDYKSALSVVSKILEAIPTDTKANRIYDDLQELQYFDIRSGVLVRYTGNSECIRIPEGVRKIPYQAWGRDNNLHRWKEIYFPDSLLELDACFFRAFARKRVVFGQNTKIISELKVAPPHPCLHPLAEEVIIRGNTDVLLPYINCEYLTLPNDFSGNVELLRFCRHLKEIKGNSQFLDEALSYDWPETGGVSIRESPLLRPVIEQKQKARWRNSNLCQYCGETFKGVFNKTCSKCGKPKDY